MVLIKLGICMYNSKWIKDINLKCKILKQVEINIAAIFQDIDTGYTLLNKNLLAEEIRTSIGKWCRKRNSRAKL